MANKRHQPQGKPRTVSSAASGGVLDSKGNDEVHDFILIEYEALRREMDEAVKETRVLERYALLVTGALWSWLIETGEPGYELVKWLPILIVPLLGYRALALTSHIDFLAEYLIKVEKVFPLPPGLGFEQLFKGSSDAEKKRATAKLFWALLLILIVVIPFISRIT